jgi:hypothetical protein
MLPKSHRLIGIIRIESPVLEVAGAEDDDSTIGGLLAGFAQSSLLANAACLSRFSRTISSRNLPYRSNIGAHVSANLEQLASDLEAEFAILSEVSA